MKRSVHNDWLLLKQDTLPKKIADTLLLCDKFHSEVVRPRVAATTTMPGVACVQQGAAEGTGSDNKDSKQEQPGVVAVQRNGGKSAGVVLTKRGKPVKCLHCNKNHWV